MCLTGYPCPWRGPCLQDGDLVRQDYDEAQTQQWIAPTPTAPAQGEGEIEW